MNNPPSATKDLTEIVQSVRLLAAAFPRAAWRAESEAVYSMALAEAQVKPTLIRAAIASLIREELELPPVALVLARCRDTATAGIELRCPRCHSPLIAADAGACICFDCDWQGTLA